MKLKSSIERDIQILTVSDSVTDKDSKILHAGIVQLFKNGKNKIILELENGPMLTPQSLREISALDVMARELSGRIVAAGVDPETQAKIVSFANPPVIPCFATREEALRYFEKEKGGGPPSLVVGEQPAASAPVVAKAPASGTPVSGEANPAKERIRQQELGDTGAVRKQLADAQAENETLREQLRAMVMDRRQAPNAAAAQTRIDELESRVMELMDRVKDSEAGASKKPGPR